MKLRNDLYRRKMSQIDYKTMTEEDYDRASIIDAALDLNGTRLHNLWYIAKAMRGKQWEEESKSRGKRGSKAC